MLSFLGLVGVPEDLLDDSWPASTFPARGSYRYVMRCAVLNYGLEQQSTKGASIAQSDFYPVYYHLRHSAPSIAIGF